MAGLTRSEILAAKDLDLKPVAVPEWGGEVFVRSMSGKERLEWEHEIARLMEAARARQGGEELTQEEVEREMTRAGVHYDLFVRSVCDSEGNLLFTAEDVPALEAKSYVALERVLAAAAGASGIPLQRGSAPTHIEDLGNSSGGTGNKK